MARFEPPETDASAPFWNATRSRELVIQWCNEGDHPVWFPRDVCPVHLSRDLGWKPASGHGTVYAFTVDHRADPPRPVALVELDEGPRLMTNIVDCDPASIAIGLAVTAAWKPLSDGRHLLQFTPRGDA